MRTEYYIFKFPHIRAWQHLLLPCMTAFCLLSSCSSDKVVEEVVEDPENITDPMLFTCNVQETTTSTRAAYLQSDFMVSAYKSFKQINQQEVMNTYHVAHSTTGTDWDGNVTHRWNYVGVDGQIERYWDYNSFPYRFNAVAPYPSDKSKITLTDTQLTINEPYKMQTWSDGVKTNSDDRVAEPYWVAQVQRATDGKDTDIITGKQITNASGSSSLNRYVALPFHHLNSKVRFAIYTTSSWATAHPMYVKDLSIKVVSADFVTEAAQYTVAGGSTDNYSWYRGTNTSGFTGLTKAPAVGTELLHYSGVQPNDPTTPLAGNDLSQWQNQATAFWFDSQVKAGLMQIPQEGVKMEVSMDLMLIDGDDVLVVPFRNLPVRLVIDGQEPTELNHWKSGNIYTYYLIIDNVGEKLEIHFTATLTPWEDLSGSLVTDLEQ